MSDHTVPHETLLHQLRWRYATKSFDSGRKISEADWSTLEEALVLSPSSYGMQPYRFVVITDPATKDALVPHSWNQRQPADCSHFVVFAARKANSEADVDDYLERNASARGVRVETLAGFKKVLMGDVVNGPRGRQSFEWAALQVYIALGNFMTSAALLGIDACPMEGIVPSTYDEVLKLTDTPWSTVVACAAGYRAPGDKYATMPKFRFPASELFIHV